MMRGARTPVPTGPAAVLPFDAAPEFEPAGAPPPGIP
jgi:hypothetical protein